MWSSELMSAVVDWCSADQSTPRPRAVNAKNELQSTVSALRRQTDDLRAQWSADCERNRTRVKCLETNITNITKEMHEKTATEAALRSTLQRARREIEDKSAELRQEREALNRLTIASQEVRLSPYHLAMLFLLTLRIALVSQVVH